MDRSKYTQVGGGVLQPYASNLMCNSQLFVSTYDLQIT